jgi:hypothetical protein
MKTKIKTQILSAILILVVIVSASCKKEKDKQIPPVMNFKTGAGYISADATLSMNDTIKIGVDCAKSEDKDLLTRFVETQRYDGGAATTILNESFNQDNYSKDMTIITRNVAGTESYNFTIINRDGITTSKTINLTVL